MAAADARRGTKTLPRDWVFARALARGPAFGGYGRLVRELREARQALRGDRENPDLKMRVTGCCLKLAAGVRGADGVLVTLKAEFLRMHGIVVQMAAAHRRNPSGVDPKETEFFVSYLASLLDAEAAIAAQISAP